MAPWERDLEIPLQETSYEIWDQKYRLKDFEGKPIDQDIQGTYRRVAKALADVEKDKKDFWEDQFFWALNNGATPAGRILSNAGAEEYKPSTSLINCTVSKIVQDSIDGIMSANAESGITLAAGCGIGYEFSTLRPAGAFVAGAGAQTTGPLPFMDMFDKMCFTIASAGGRRGAQMATFAVWHPDIREFIKAKREDGRLRQFNLSILITDSFMEAVKEDKEWELYFPVSCNEVDNSLCFQPDWKWKPLEWEEDYCLEQGYSVDEEEILCKIYETIKARDLYELIMQSTYDFAEPGFLLIDRINELNNNNYCEVIRATNPCGQM